MVLDDATIICRIEENSTISNDNFTPSKNLDAIFNIDGKKFTVQVATKKWSNHGNYIAVKPVSQLAQFQRRKSYRLSTKNSIGYRIVVEETGNTYRGISIEDISQGGIGLILYTGTEIVTGTRVKIFIKFSKGSDPIIIQGEVANCAKYGDRSRAYRLGVRFAEIKPEDLQSIATYIAEHRSSLDFDPIPLTDIPSPENQNADTPSIENQNNDIA